LLNPDFRDMLLIFSEEQVEYMVVGAYALAAHGLPRATGDIDLWIKRSEENANRVWQSLMKFGVPSYDLKKEDLMTPGIVFQIGVAPRRIDILSSIDGVEFEEAMKDCIEVEIEGLKITVIGREHLIKNKRAAGRPKDQADVAWLESMENQ
jgi:predicted nucleotidyltransferase